MKNAIIVTTINLPVALTAYAKDIADNGPEDTVIVVVGDKKTPAQAKEFVEKLPCKTMYLDPEDQELFLTTQGMFQYRDFLPWGCIQRRNVGILYAYFEGAEKIITIDDDNFLLGDRFVAGHALGDREITALSSSSGWVNMCLFLREEKGAIFYHRGYSMRERGKPEPVVTETQGKRRVVVNAGLWIGDPDVDAVTRMAIRPNVIEPYGNKSLALAIKTKCPFNSQNTALDRDVIPAYCLASGVGRHDDIFASYVVKRIADHLGHYIAFGPPYVKQERNAHDLWKDLEAEKDGMNWVDDFVDWLYDKPLKGSSYLECFKEIVANLEEIALTAPIKALYENYKLWSELPWQQ